MTRKPEEGRRIRRLLIAGLGSIGQLHRSVVRALRPKCELVLLRREGLLGFEPQGQGREYVVHRLEAALELGVDAAIIATPAHLHVDAAQRLADAGVPFLVEKPLAATLAGVDKLVETVVTRGLPAMVGYNLRFHPVVEAVRAALQQGSIGRPMVLRVAVGQYLPDWRPGRDYRATVTARQEAGGGVLLELSHELDYACWLLGRGELAGALTGKLSGLEIDVEDTAEILLRFPNGAFGSVHLDCTQRCPSREGWLTGSEGTLRWDFLQGKVELYEAASGRWTPIREANPAARDVTYTAQLRHFFECVEAGSEVRTPLSDGRAVLELALRARDRSITSSI